MLIVKLRTARVALAVFLVQCFLSPLAAAQDMASALDNQPRVMFYASKAFGDSGALRSAPRLGLRFERSSEHFGLARNAGLQTHSYRAMAEFRWTKGYGQSLLLAGAPVYASALHWESERSSSIAQSSVGFGNRWIMAGVITLGAAAVFCVLETIICEDSKDNYQIPDIGTPGNGT